MKQKHSKCMTQITQTVISINMRQLFSSSNIHLGKVIRQESPNIKAAGLTKNRDRRLKTKRTRG